MIPVLSVTDLTLAKTYEKALIELYRYGTEMKTQYDKPEDPPSIDATMNMTILEPMTDPMIHKAFPGGIEDLKEYFWELLGYKDCWVKNMNDPEDTRWEYTYHSRLADWGTWYEKSEKEERIKKNKGINQFAAVVNKLANNIYTRQAQMITWMPFLDNNAYDAPCLQSLHYRLSEEGTRLNCNVRFRSNDAWGANFMNMFGIVLMNYELILKPLQYRLGHGIMMDRLNWQADSFHIYGKDLKDIKERFINRLDSTTFKDRVYNFQDEMIQEIWNEADEKIKRKIRDHEATI